MSDEMRGIQRFAGRGFDEGVPAQARAGGEDFALEVVADSGRRDQGFVAAGDGFVQVVEHLRREHFAEEVVVVVDGREGEVELRGPVGARRAIVGRGDVLEAGDEFPPGGIEVGGGVGGVEGTLEVRHHEAPTSEDEELRGLFLRRRRGDRARLAGRDARIGAEPGGVAREASDQHRDRLGRQDMRDIAQEKGQVVAQILIVDGVSEFVQEGSHPLLGGRTVTQNANVLEATDMNREGVLALGGPLVQVGAIENIANVQADVAEEGRGDGGQIGKRREEAVQIDRAGRGLLKERVAVVVRA